MICSTIDLFDPENDKEIIVMELSRNGRAYEPKRFIKCKGDKYEKISPAGLSACHRKSTKPGTRRKYRNYIYIKINNYKDKTKKLWAKRQLENFAKCA